jgi:hypothetical protein
MVPCGTKGRRETVMGWVSKAALWQEAKLRILGLALVGSLALIVPIAAQSAFSGQHFGNRFAFDAARDPTLIV